MTADVHDLRLALRASGLLAQFNAGGVLSAADVHVARTLARLADEADEQVLLAVALAVRAVRQEGSVCVDLSGAHVSIGEVDVDADPSTLPWPDVDEWYAACRASPLVAEGIDGPADRPVRLIGELLYLDRYWREEQLVRAELADRATRTAPEVDEARLLVVLSQLYPDVATNHQRLAVAASITGLLTTVAGGPGTGKTTTVARLLAALAALSDQPPRVALAAPTGKAAARLQEAVAAAAESLTRADLPAPAATGASTLHRLLGWRPDSHSRFRYNRDNRLPFDVVIVDETSMVSLTMMSRLLEALRPDTRLVLVGDPDQLASVEAGAVLGDLVHREPRAAPDARATRLASLLPADFAPRAEVEAELRNDVVRLRRGYRFGDAIGELADAIRDGDADKAMSVLRAGADEVEFVEASAVDRRSTVVLARLRRDVVDSGRALIDAARAGDAQAALDALEHHRLLCAHRVGPHGVASWAAEVERWLRDAIDGYGAEGDWYVGRPLLVTANDYEIGLYNGDTGVVVDDGDGGLVAAFGRGSDPVLRPPSRLSNVTTVHAMTVHRSQGSQFRRVSVLLPEPSSRLLTRELLYTAVTRARAHVRLVGAEESVRAAIARPVVRASGLRARRVGS